MAKLKHFLVLDLETYYDREEVTLRKLSAPEYIWHPKFKVHLLAVYDTAWAAPKIILPHEIPDFLAQYPASETVSLSHNALFDACVLGWRYGWVPGLLLDTLGMCRALRDFKRNSLGEAAEALLGYNPKGNVIHKVAGLDPQGIKNAGLWPQYCTYALQDAMTCYHIFCKLLPEFPVEERRVMDLVLRAAVQPVLHADVALLDAHLTELRLHKAELLRNCGYDKAALMSTAMFKQALERLGIEVKTKQSATGRPVPAFAKTDPFMTELLEYDQADARTNHQVQTLAAARLSHRSTIEETRAERFSQIAKLPWGNGSALLPVALRYGGAHTHRLSGEWRMNMQNLPRDKEKSKLRAAICAPPGHQLVTADLAQIEARIVACLCGEHKLTAEFRDGVDVYSSFAAFVFKRSITKKTHPGERFIGKVSVLGLGYGCGHVRFFRMVTVQARQSQIDLAALAFDEDTAQDIVNQYRFRFPRIKASWAHLDNLKVRVLDNPHAEPVHWGPVRFEPARIVLPNGMVLRYQRDDPHLYGAKMLENVVQALARVVLMQAALRLARRGARFVLQSHDELGFVVADEQVERVKPIIVEEMTRTPDWLLELPLAVEVGVGSTYGSCK
jgi:DNA polymerase bacteriophage-type